MNATCQCGSVSFKTPTPKPLALYICHCQDCQRQTSSAFGTSAIFPRFPLPDAELLSCYKRPTSTGETLYCYFCKQCGTRLIHTTPVPIPEGCESYTESPGPTEYSDSQEVLDQPTSLI
ncbi:134d2a85-ec49-4053-97a2-ccc5e1d1fc70 [Thermothielavioides terrestris]|uniref:134d2a85-ec49-4053-97a2-ccc5e1d1fc70 n=1 Tax=Thermothielavioides terrestris TaxID=2587410 RepID=A0A3S4BEP4_9PEZI|nr:134d2a85-ec49-4053-97a2-ccc5e1d1fc70 [Thermothielavioides terrestris]